MYNEEVVNDAVAYVRRIGWNVIYDPHGPHTYSQGFPVYNHPDIIITGMLPVVAYRFIGELFRNVRDGKRYKPNHEYYGIAEDNYPARFRSVDISNATAMCGINTVIYRLLGYPTNLGFLQLIFPDKFRRWPWEKDSLVRSAVWPLDIANWYTMNDPHNDL